MPDKPLAKFVKVADMHFNGQKLVAEQSRMLDILNFVNRHVRPDVVQFLGDQILNGTLNELLRFKNTVDNGLAFPYKTAFGNHDGKDYDKVFGSPHYSYDLGEVRVIVTAIDYTDMKKGVGRYTQFGWLQDQLEAAAGKPVVVVMHQPVFPPSFENAAEVHALLNRFPNIRIVIAGHTHIPVAPTMKGNVLYETDAAAYQPKCEFAIILVYVDRVEIQYVRKEDGRYKVFEAEDNAVRPDPEPPFEKAGMSTNPMEPEEFPVGPKPKGPMPTVEPPPIPQSRITAAFKAATVQPVALPRMDARMSVAQAKEFARQIPDMLTHYGLW
jgi:predicted phosphodiesterase